jgi:hypothetical protein
VNASAMYSCCPSGSSPRVFDVLFDDTSINSLPRYQSQRCQRDFYRKGSRRQTSQLLAMRTGHGFFRSYLYRIPSSAIDNPRCSCGSASETPKHLLLDCKHFKTQRKELKRKIGQLPMDLQSLLYTNKGLEATAEFLATTGIGTRTSIQGYGSSPTCSQGDHSHWNGNEVGWGRFRQATEEGEEGED